MPVTTPASYVDDLKDSDHFGHVLTHLFAPALGLAGYTVIPPRMLGATLIHAEIIRHLEQADLVLADLSSHNANVFFELGIRTSLNRPVVLVKDRRTSEIPFDLGTINVLTYGESLAPWVLDEEVKRLAEHVRTVETGGDSSNAMWQYFGLTKRGEPTEAGGLEAKVDLLLSEITKLRLAPELKAETIDGQRSYFSSKVALLAGRAGYRRRIMITQDETTGDLDVHMPRGLLESELKRQIEEEADEEGITVNFVAI